MRNGLMTALLVLAAGSASAQQKPIPPAPGTPGGSLDLKPIGLQPLALNNLSYSPLSLPRLDFGSARQMGAASVSGSAAQSQQSGAGTGAMLMGGTTPFMVLPSAPAITGRTQPFGSNMLTFDITGPSSAAKSSEPATQYEAYRQKVWDQYNYKPPTQSATGDPFLTGGRTR